MNTGCNIGSGQYILTSDEISVTIESYTEMSCNDPMIIEAETHVVDVFLGPILSLSMDHGSWIMDHGSESLNAMNGEMGLTATFVETVSH